MAGLTVDLTDQPQSNSMKRCFLTIAVLFIGFYLFADSHVSPEVNIHYSGFSQYNTASHNLKYKPKLGFKVGFSADTALWDVFLLQVGLFLNVKRATNEEHDGNSSLKENICLTYIEAPYNFGYRFTNSYGGNFFIITGPFVRLGLSGKYESETIANGQKIDYKTSKMFDYSDDAALYKALDFGWNFGIGAMLPSGLYARIDYGIALTNIAKAASSKAKNVDGFGISVGYHIDRDRRPRY
jgi:hypothetical protein